MQKYANDNITLSGTSIEGSYDLVINEEIDIDDSNAPSIEPDAKKKNKAEKEALEKERKKRNKKLGSDE